MSGQGEGPACSQRMQVVHLAPEFRRQRVGVFRTRAEGVRRSLQATVPLALSAFACIGCNALADIKPDAAQSPCASAVLMTDNLHPAATIVGNAIFSAGSCGTVTTDGKKCSAPAEPAANIELKIMCRATNALVSTVRTQSDGSFQIRLPPAAYVLALKFASENLILADVEVELRPNELRKLEVVIQALRP